TVITMAFATQLLSALSGGGGAPAAAGAPPAAPMQQHPPPPQIQPPAQQFNANDFKDPGFLAKLQKQWQAGGKQKSSNSYADQAAGFSLPGNLPSLSGMFHPQNTGNQGSGTGPGSEIGG